MTLLLALPALAALPWECPAIAEPSDAVVYRDTDGGLVDTWQDLYDAAYAYVDAGCAWVETTTVEYTTTTTERVCEGEGSTVTWTESVYEDSGFPVVHTETTTYAVALPSGEAWTRLEVTEARTRRSSTGSSYGGDVVRGAAWTGALTGLPDDGWFSVEEGYWHDMGGSSQSRSVDTPACDFAWRSSSAGYDITETVGAPDHTVSVTRTYDGYACGEYGAARASVDGAMVGLVDGDTWERDLSDADGDGYSAGACDCDDADAARNEEAWDLPNDGIDQDCDGSDRVESDVDNDGYDALAFGGDDCDDADGRVHPSADDFPGDGVDKDCDGADDVDADGDGYTADGDDEPADCDDARWAVSPGWHEVACDGVDQDCDGEDRCDAEDTAEEPPDEPPVEDTAEESVEEPPSTSPPEEDEGCGGAAAWLMFVPLLGIRRRRA